MTKVNLQQKLARALSDFRVVEHDHARETNPERKRELERQYENLKARIDLMTGGVDPDEAGALPAIPAPAPAPAEEKWMQTLRDTLSAPDPTELAPAAPEPTEPAKPKRAKRERPKSRPQRWQDACATVREALAKAREACDEVEQAFADLNEVRGEYVEWKENLSDNLANSAVGEKLQAVEDLDIDDAHSDLDNAISELESKVDDAEGLDLPLGFGRD